MTKVEQLTYEQMPALRDALTRHGAGGLDGVDGQRMSVITQALKTDAIALAWSDAGEVVGYTANRHDTGGGFELVECAGEVFAPWRGQGHGGALIDWAIAEAGRGAQSDMVEIVVDSLGIGDALAAMLTKRGFTASQFVELTAPVKVGGPQESGIWLEPMGQNHIGEVTSLYQRASRPEPLARGGDAAIVTVLRHPYLERAFCFVAREAGTGATVGFVLSLVWPDSPTDLWIETICVDPERGEPEFVSDIAADVLRRAATRFATASMGTSEPMAEVLSDAGFTRRRTWARHSLLLWG